MLIRLNNLKLAVRMAGHSIAYLSRGNWRKTSPTPHKACQVPDNFFGLCVANAPESTYDDYVIARLNELGIRHVRLDFTYGDRDAFTERFLDRLLAGQFRICLHLVQPREEAHAMLGHPGAADRWRVFVSDMLDRYGSRVALIEIGTTCNRRKWSGYSPDAFLAAWQIAWEEAHARHLKIAGPNVTDFEPVYNAGWLGVMRRANLLPSAHTDNLFVERATEPETFDKKVAGQYLAGLFRFNLVRKAQLLQDIGTWAGVPALVCTHVTWSLRRIARFLEDVEEKQADYLARYACLAAASGALTRVYWGPLIGQREGLIDDGTSEYPELPHVTYYEQARGKLKDYRLRPAFSTFRTVNHLLSGATFQRCLATDTGLEILEFRQGGPRTDNGDGNRKSKIIHAVWTTDGNGASADACYPQALLAQAEIYTRDGQRLEHAPKMFSESPVFILWPSDVCQPSSGVRHLISGFRFARRPGWDFDIVHAGNNALGLAGVYLIEDGRKRVDIQTLLDSLRESNAEYKPRNLECSEVGNLQSTIENPATSGTGQKLVARYAPAQILRDSRNTVWSTCAPWDIGRKIVVKAFKPRSAFRRFLDHGKPNKALRSWNGAQELLRRGLHTPTPIACLIPDKEIPDNTSPRAVSYYICETFAPAWSARDTFTAFSTGATEFQGQAAHDWYVAIAVFLQKLHTRGVYFRDLSAGNLLMRRTPAGELEFALIDTARARFYPHNLDLRLRLCDLMRICHPLDWPNRCIFVEQYLAHNGRRLTWWMKIPFWYYDWKHRVKNVLKRK